MKATTRRRIFSIAAFFSFIIALALGTSLAVAMNDGLKKIPIKQYFPQDQTNAIWDWSNVRTRSHQELQENAEFMYMHQINTTYIDVSSYESIARTKNVADRKRQEVALSVALERYISAMHKHHIRVFAMAGNVNWSKPAYQDIPLAIQQFAMNFNKTHPQKLAGVEFDIEAYNQEGFADASFTEKELVLDEFLDTVDRLASAHSAYIKRSGDHNFELGFAIPYWYDNENGNIKSVSWHDKTGPVLYHLMDRLNQLPRSNAVVMAYRNAASGNDGMVYHSRLEVDYAHAKAPHVSVLIGMEMNNVEPAKITFYGSSYTEVSSQAKLVHDEFQNRRSYGGIAINDLAGYQALGQGGKVEP